MEKSQIIQLIILLVMCCAHQCQGQIKELKFDFIVSKDGTGDFKTIMEAVTATLCYTATPDSSLRRIHIYIKAGVFQETVIVNIEKINITFIGDGVEKTIITASKSNGTGTPTYYTATVGIKGDGFTAQDLTIENSATDNTQAVALLTEAKHIALYRCKIIGYQDTLFAKEGTQFFRDCEISGTVDFIFGNAITLFQNCNILTRLPIKNQSVMTITAQGREWASQNSGTIFQNCVIKAESTVFQNFPSTVKVYLGRPWRDFSRVVIMQSFLEKLVDPTGWLEWTGESKRIETVYYGEFDNKGSGANITSRVKWPGYKIINYSEATQFTARNFIQGHEWIPATGIPVNLDLK